MNLLIKHKYMQNFSNKTKQINIKENKIQFGKKTTRIINGF
jgi:hypothetical protein